MASEAPPSRRWTSRLLHLLPRRRRRAPDSQRASVAPVDTRLVRRSRRNRHRRPSDARPRTAPFTYSQSNSAPTLPSQAAVRFRRLDGVDDVHDNNHAHGGVMYSVLADVDVIGDGDMFAIVDRMSDDDDYQVARTDFQYFQERVRYGSHRNAYYFTRRQTRANRLAEDYMMEVRRNVRMLRTSAAVATADPTSANRYECAASDDQIEALPTIILEKGETRSVKEIFDNLRDDAATSEHTSDECGGLMTSYTECAICLCEFEAGDEITALPCGHFFHLTGCVREWLRNHARTCPTCRADICAPSCGSDDVNSHSATMATSEDLT
ncbi:hypothetical protein FGB62_58g127 [Gracilaria domingensis]|nr:hypothetical protein FGB62_58g127 [Gracilaria domingensis]